MNGERRRESGAGSREHFARARRASGAGGRGQRQSAAGRIGAAALVLLLPLACSRDEQPLPRQAPPSTSERLVVAAGEFRAGGPVAERTAHNPVAEMPGSLARGKQLFVWFNCAGCHGLKGGGGMGPPLLDANWIYGSDPASIFQTIAQGRPNGMPAFGGKVPDAELWHLVTYVRSLGGADSVVRAGGTSGRSPTEAMQSKRSQ